MFRKKLSVLILLTATIILLSSCDGINNCLEIYQGTKQFNSADTSSSSVLNDSSYDNSQQQNTNDKFDIEETRKKLWLNGKQFTLPCTAEDLGDEYYYHEFTLVKVNNEKPDPTYYQCGLYSKHFKDELANRLGITLKNTSRGDNLLKNQICGIRVTNANIDFKIDTISMHSATEEILTCFGEPTIIKEIGNIKAYRYIDPNNVNNLLNIIIDNGLITEIAFYYE